MNHYSPLRYPGGKRRLVDSITSLLEENELTDIHYAEPFAGGASVALALLYGEYASVIHLNDLSRPVYAFWRTALEDTEWMCDRVDGVRVNMNTWRRQRAIYRRESKADLAELGFATLFLNRCNRSGILHAGVIGGKQQAGKWRITARFGRRELIERIQQLGRYANRIRLYRMDAIDFIDKTVAGLGKNAFAFIDPPYIDSGQDLYLNDLTIKDHQRLAKRVLRLSQHWIVTYDRAAIGHGLYPNCRRMVYDLHYVAHDRYFGREVMFMSKKLQLPELPTLLGPRMHLVPRQSRLMAV